MFRMSKKADPRRRQAPKKRCRMLRTPSSRWSRSIRPIPAPLEHRKNMSKPLMFHRDLKIVLLNSQLMPVCEAACQKTIEDFG